MQTVPEPQSRRAERFDSPQQAAFLNLWRTYDHLKALEDDLFSGYDLSAQQYNALRLLRACHPEKLPTLMLAGRLVSRAPDITRLVDRLVERGLAVRERPESNRRAVYVGLTESGLALLDSLADQVRECHLRQLGHLEPDELARLTELLVKARAPHEPAECAWPG